MNLSQNSDSPGCVINRSRYLFSLDLLNKYFSIPRLYAVIIVRVTADFDANEKRIYDDVGPYVNSDLPYVAAAWSNVQDIPNIFTVGDDSVTRVDGVSYTNVPLRSNTQYAALVRVEIVSDNPNMVSIRHCTMTIKHLRY